MWEICEYRERQSGHLRNGHGSGDDMQVMSESFVHKKVGK